MCCRCSSGGGGGGFKPSGKCPLDDRRGRFCLNSFRCNCAWSNTDGICPVFSLSFVNFGPALRSKFLVVHHCCCCCCCSVLLAFWSMVSERTVGDVCSPLSSSSRDESRRSFGDRRVRTCSVLLAMVSESTNTSSTNVPTFLFAMIHRWYKRRKKRHLQECLSSSLVAVVAQPTEIERAADILRVTSETFDSLAVFEVIGEHNGFPQRGQRQGE